MKKKIGFIGLGVMAKPMAKNLMKAGYSLSVNDIVKEPVRELVALGAKEAESAKGRKGFSAILTLLEETTGVKARLEEK